MKKKIKTGAKIETRRSGNAVQQGLRVRKGTICCYGGLRRNAIKENSGTTILSSGQTLFRGHAMVKNGCLDEHGSRSEVRLSRVVIVCLVFEKIRSADVLH